MLGLLREDEDKRTIMPSASSLRGGSGRRKHRENRIGRQGYAGSQLTGAAQAKRKLAVINSYSFGVQGCADLELPGGPDSMAPTSEAFLGKTSLEVVFVHHLEQTRQFLLQKAYMHFYVLSYR